MRLAPTTIWIVIGALFGNPLLTAQPAPGDPYDWVASMLSDKPSVRAAAADRLAGDEDLSMVPGLVDAVFFTPSSSRRQIFGLLASLTGEDLEDYYEWVEWVGAHGEIEPAPGYQDWKLSLLARIDPQYRTVFYQGAPARIRLEEIVWGGVPLAGIPALDDPPTLAGSSARYLKKRGRVFGLVLNGEARAYPVRILSWHELLNDRLGGEPIALSFCTLCGSGIFYLARTPNGGAHRFDTSGLLYRSNKLMVDRQSRTLWSNLTGEPVLGRLARIRQGLQILPGTLTTWESWLRENPQTTVLDLEAIQAQMRPRYSYDYRPGVAERSRRGVSFPVWLKNDVLDRDAQVFALRLAEGAKAYPVDRVLETGLVNDRIGTEPVLVVGDRTSGSVRAYRRGPYQFEMTSTGWLEDNLGGRWSVEERGLRNLDDAQEPLVLERLPGHVALWFGWYGFYPQTEVWLD